MKAKTTPVSVRITPQDAEFIASLDIDEAITPSDKIRALLKEAREGRKKAENFSSCLGLIRAAIDPILLKLKEAEMKEKMHSQLVSSFGEWLVDLLSYMASLENCDKYNLTEIEAEMGTRIFRLFGVIARLGITREAPCYDVDLLSKQLPPLIELMELVYKQVKKGESK